MHPAGSTLQQPLIKPFPLRSRLYTPLTTFSCLANLLPPTLTRFNQVNKCPLILSEEMSYQILEQDIIPSISPRLYVYSHHISHAGRVAKILRDRNRPTIGISIQLSNRGNLDAIVLSTGPYVHYVSCDDEEVDEENFFLSKLLNSQFGTIVGFNMARLAIHIYRALGVNSSGVDLSTVHPDCRTRLWNPSELVLRKLYPHVDKHKLDSLWYGKNGDTASRDACLRAWISAKYVDHSFLFVGSY